MAEWKSGQDAHGLVAPADGERDEEKDHEVCPTVAANPMHDGKTHEYAHRNERAEALQIAIVQQSCGAQEHIESDEDAKPCIPCSRLFAHGLPLIPSVVIDLATVAAAILAIVPASSIARPQFMEFTA